jgi:hypothetical protein
MGWLVRKITRHKWHSDKPDLEPTFIAADAITNDLKADHNRLSFWECDHDPKESDLDRVAVAMAGGWQRPDKMDIAWLERSLLESKGVKFEKTQGVTPLVDLKDLHVDAISLDLSRFEQLYHLLANSIRKDNKCKRYTKTEIVELLCKAVREGRLSVNDLDEKLRERLKIPHAS